MLGATMGHGLMKVNKEAGMGLYIVYRMAFELHGKLPSCDQFSHH